MVPALRRRISRNALQDPFAQLSGLNRDGGPDLFGGGGGGGETETARVVERPATTTRTVQTTRIPNPLASVPVSSLSAISSPTPPPDSAQQPTSGPVDAPSTPNSSSTSVTPNAATATKPSVTFVSSSAPSSRPSPPSYAPTSFLPFPQSGGVATSSPGEALPSDSSSPSSSSSSSSSSPSSTQLSPTGIIILLCLAAAALLLLLAVLTRCVRLRIRRRRHAEFAIAFSRSQEKNAWDASEQGLGKSPSSTIFGGRERTGSPPRPSWASFADKERAGSPSPYPLGLLPPPTNLPASSRPPHTPNGAGVGLGSLYSRRTENGQAGSAIGGILKRLGDPAKTSNVRFQAPTITITDSSPTLAHGQPTLYHGVGYSPSDSETPDRNPNRNRVSVSVCTDPIRGARLVTAPRLQLVNDDPSPSLSDSDGTRPRNSGWSSWDDSVGVELGVTIDRKLAPRPRPRPRQRPRSRLNPVEEESSGEAGQDEPVSPHGSRSRLQPTSAGRIRRDGSRLGGNTRSRSPRQGRGPPLLYKLPQFSPSTKADDDSTRVASPGSTIVHTPRLSPSMPPRATSTRFSRVSTTALSSTESEELQVRHRPVKSQNQPSGHRNPDEAVMGTTPAVGHTVGRLMLSTYEDEEDEVEVEVEVEVDPSRSRCVDWRDADDGGRGTRVAQRPPGSGSVGLGLSLPSERARDSVPSRRRQSGQRKRRRSSASKTYHHPSWGQGSPSSVYSRATDYYGRGSKAPSVDGRSRTRQQPPTVPSVPSVPSTLPSPGRPNLHQMKLIREMPDYRSPTYSFYGMYRDENRTSPLQATPETQRRDETRFGADYYVEDCDVYGGVWRGDG